MTIVQSESNGRDVPAMLSEALPADLVFMEVLHDLLRLFVTEEQIQQFLRTLGVDLASCVVDTNVWLADITRTLKTGKPSGLLRAARIGTFGLYGSTVVLAEVPEKISARAKSLKIDPEQVRRLWETNYLPYIRFLDPTYLPLSGTRVLVCDPDDVATGQLIELLRPSIVLSLDKKHLGDFAIVSDPVNWTMFAAAYRDHAERDALVVSLYLGGGTIVSLSFEAVRGIIAAVAQLDKRFLLALAAELGAAIVFPPTRRVLQGLVQSLSSFARSDLVRENLQTIVTQAATKYAKAAEAKRFLLEQERPVSQPIRVLEFLLFILSRAEGALSVMEVTRRMIDLGYEPRGEYPERHVRRLLRAHPEWFEREETGHWKITKSRIESEKGGNS